MARFAITTVSNPMSGGTLNNGTTVIKLAQEDGSVKEESSQKPPIGTSVRESRAKRHARKLVKDGVKNVMLWRVDGASPVPIRYREQPVTTRYASNNGCNSVQIERDLPEKVLKNAPGTRSLAGKMDFIFRRNRAVHIAMEAHNA